MAKIFYNGLPGGGGSTKAAENVFPPAQVSNQTITSSGVDLALTWTDPSDQYYLPGIYNQTYPLALWAGTKVVRKAGSNPTSVTDGTLVLNSTVRNKYTTSAFVDTGLTVGTTYHYGFFPYTKRIVGQPVYLSKKAGKEYSITWRNADGTVLKSEKVYEGDVPAFDGATPTLPATQWPFSGWNPTPAKATADITYYAMYETPGSMVLSGTLEDIATRLDDGTYKTFYKVGDNLYDESSNPVVYRIAAFDTDRLAQTDGYAKVTLIKMIGDGVERTNSGSSSVNKAAGTVSNIKTSESGAAEYAKMANFPDAVKSRIATVTKQTMFTESSKNVPTDSNGDWWIPSLYELIGTALSRDGKTEDIFYNEAFPDKASRIYYGANGSALMRWLRGYFYDDSSRLGLPYVGNEGGTYMFLSNTSLKTAFMTTLFCMD